MLCATKFRVIVTGFNLSVIEFMVYTLLKLYICDDKRRYIE